MTSPLFLLMITFAIGVSLGLVGGIIVSFVSLWFAFLINWSGKRLPQIGSNGAQHPKRVIMLKHHRLQKLKEKQASFGLETPVHILMEIEDLELEIENLQAELLKKLDAPIISETSEGSTDRFSKFAKNISVIAGLIILLLIFDNVLLSRQAHPTLPSAPHRSWHTMVIIWRFLVYYWGK